MHRPHPERVPLPLLIFKAAACPCVTPAPPAYARVCDSEVS